jgi:outer membrane protein, heavy metal efflux system
VPSVDEAQLLTAVASDPRTALWAAEVEAAKAEALAENAKPNPSLGYDREALVSAPPGEDLATNYLRLSVPLEISGKRSARHAAARAEVVAMTAEGEAARLALELAALRSFRLAQYQRARRELLRAERAALAGAVEVVRKRAAAGDTSGYDLQRIELELAAYDDLLLDAGGELHAARAQLGEWLGSGVGVDAAGALAIPGEPQPLPAAFEQALAQRPELRAAAAREAGAEALDRAGRRGWIPELVLSAGLMNQQLSSDDGDDDDAWGYTAGVSLALPFFERGQADRARARAQKRRAEATRQQLARTVPAAIRARHHALARTIERARAAEQLQLTRLAQLLRSAEAAYRDGGGDIVALVDAYTTARDLRLRALELWRDAQLAQLELWLALGRRP